MTKLRTISIRCQYFLWRSLAQNCSEGRGLASTSHSFQVHIAGIIRCPYLVHCAKKITVLNLFYTIKTKVTGVLAACLSWLPIRLWHFAELICKHSSRMDPPTWRQLSNGRFFLRTGELNGRNRHEIGSNSPLCNSYSGIGSSGKQKQMQQKQLEPLGLQVQLSHHSWWKEFCKPV